MQLQSLCHESSWFKTTSQEVNKSNKQVKRFENSKIKAAQVTPKAYTFLSNIDKGVALADIQDHLKTVFGVSESFKIEEVPARSEEIKSFKITSKPEIQTRLLDHNNWPSEVVVRKFGFFRGTHSQRGGPRSHYGGRPYRK